MPQPMLPSATGETSVRERLAAKLTDALQPSWLEVIDESHLHAGHAGWRPGEETHLRVRVMAEAFKGKSRIARHRIINELAAAELQAGLHALAVEAKAPGDADSENGLSRPRPTGGASE